MDELEYRRAVARALDDAVEMTQPQLGRVAGLILGLHGVTAASVQAFWRELSAPDQSALYRALRSLSTTDADSSA